MAGIITKTVKSSVKNKPHVGFLMGPTASGKTDLAIALSHELPIDIISVDSALIYRGMDIGTAKPSEEELAQAPHALIDICDPAETYSAADFCRDARREIETSHRKERLPLLVGGTMMYYKALLDGLADMPASDEVTKRAIDAEADEKGWPALHQQLMEVDPEYAAEIHPNHSQRISRALAVYRISGKTMTEYRKLQKASPALGLEDDYEVVQLALIPQDRGWLHERIDLRFRLMLEAGFKDEVESLRQRQDLHLDLPSMRSVGYRQMWQYLDGEYDYSTMVEKGLAATRQLAKRQLTWLRGWPNANFLELVPNHENKSANCQKNFENALKFLQNQSI